MTKKTLFCLVAAIVIFLSGIYLGHEKGMKMHSTQYDCSTITDLKIKLKLLTSLRNGDISKCEEMLEYLADNDIQYLHGKLEMKVHNQQADKEIIETLREAKKYRTKYPEHKSDKNYSKNIDDYLRIVGE